MTSNEDWTWKFAPRAAAQFDDLDHEGLVLEVHRIEHRSGAYTADD